MKEYQIHRGLELTVTEAEKQKLVEKLIAQSQARKPFGKRMIEVFRRGK